MKPLKIALIAAVGIGAIGLGGGIWVRTSIDARWARMEQRIQALHAETIARPADRPILRGNAVPGDAWDDYGRALADDLRPVAEMIDAFALRPDPADRAAALRTLHDHSPAIDALRQGARRSACRVPVD